VAHLDKRHFQDLDSHAFVSVAPSGAEEPPPVVFGVTARTGLRPSTHTAKVPLRWGHHLHLDTRIPPTPPRLPHLAPSHTASVDGSGDDVRVVRVWTTAPHAWVRGSNAGQGQSRDVERRPRDRTIAW